MRINKFLPFALIYFFINALALPMGLTYTALLGPLFYAWVILKTKKEILLPFLAILSPFIILHVFVTGVDLMSYGITLLNIIMVYFFCHAVYCFLTISFDYEKIFRVILITNFILCLAAIIFYFTPWAPVFWIRQNVSSGIDQFMRLKMLTYEASHYALLFVPLFGFYFFQYLLRLNTIRNLWLIPMLFLPLILSFSIGVMGAMFFAGSATLVLHFHSLAPKRQVVNSLITVTVFGMGAFFIMLLFFRDNAFFLRISNILLGNDSSGEGRTSNAFYLATKILEDNHAEWWGIGPGQLKIVGEDIIRAYYLYYEKTPVAIPNAAAETLLLFGWVGFGLRFFLQFLFFALTKPWKNYYRFFLFVFMFIYQFTGSYITNPAEYLIWVFAFIPVFEIFNAKITRPNIWLLPINK